MATDYEALSSNIAQYEKHEKNQALSAINLILNHCVNAVSTNNLPEKGNNVLQELVVTNKVGDDKINSRSTCEISNDMDIDQEEKIEVKSPNIETTQPCEQFLVDEKTVENEKDGERENYKEEGINPPPTVTEPVKLVVHSYHWDIIDGSHYDEKTEIRAWCLDRQSNPYLLRIPDFPIVVPMELPQYIDNRMFNWSSKSCQRVVDYLCHVLNRNGPKNFNSMGDVGYSTKIYYLQERKTQFIFLKFNNLKAVKACKTLLETPRKIHGIGNVVKLNLYETSINLVRKLLTDVNCGFSKWFESHGELVSELDKVSTLKREYVINWRSIKELDYEWVTEPGVLALDIEANSSNSKAFPDAAKSLDRTYMISCVYERINHPETRRNILLLYGISSAPNEGIEHIYVNSERELYEKLGEIIRELDPEIITGYNLFGFDYPYMDKRLKRDNLKWGVLGRIINEEAFLKSDNWSSSGYGHNALNILKMSGRITIDLLLVVRREHKLPKYDLDTVAKKFLGKGKNNVTAQMMFHVIGHLIMLESILELWRPLIDQYASEGDDAILYKLRNVDRIIAWIIDQTRGKSEYSVEFINQMIDMVNYVAERVNEIGEYCIRDSEAVLQLFNKLNTWIYLIELSNIAGVTPMDLFTRGQQLRGVSLIYNLAHKMGYILDSREYKSMSWSGGFVWEPDPGLYPSTICLDFKSLYPNIIRAYNICWTTLIPPWLDKYVSDDKCNVIEWDEPLDMGDYEEDDVDSGESEAPNEWADITEGVDKDGKEIKYMHYRFKFLKAEYKEGLLPQLAGMLIDRRDEVRESMKGVKDPVLKTILNQRQLGLKVTANSLFGMLGAGEKGRLPLLEAAMCITAKGRELITFCNDYLVQKYGASVVYNDSVTGDTPLLVRRIVDGVPQTPYWTRIDELPHEKSIESKTRSELDNYEVWSDKEWTKINKVICHYTKKKIYRVRTSTGLVDVTEDHSLLDENCNEVRPSDIKIGDLLMHMNLPDVVTKADSFSPEDAYDAGYIYGDFNQENNWFRMPANFKTRPVLLDYYKRLLVEKRIPNEIFQASISVREAFFSGVYNGNYRRFYQVGIKVANKFEAAELFHLAQSIGHHLTIIEKRNYFILKSTESNTSLDLSIKSIKVLNNDNGQYVYDLETENHHFSAGIGRLVVHNTDSTMVQIPNVTDGKDLLEWGKKLELEISALFPRPLYLEFEKAGPMLVIRKKNYAFWILKKDGSLPFDEDGNPIFMPRGIPLARRDKPMWQTKIVAMAINMILKGASAQEFLDMIVENVVKTLRGEVDWQDFIIIRSLGASYKSNNYFMKVFADELAKMGCPAQAGDRLEYVIVIPAETPPKDLLGYKMRTPEIYLERLKSDKPEQINYLYHVENLLMGCLEQYWLVGYKNIITETMSKNKHSDHCLILDELRTRGFANWVDQGLKVNDNDPIRAVEALLQTAIKNKVIEARRKYISGRHIFDTRLSDKPIKTLLKGYKTGRLEEAVKGLASPDLYNKLYPKYKSGSSLTLVMKQTC